MRPDPEFRVPNPTDPFPGTRIPEPGSRPFARRETPWSDEELIAELQRVAKLHGGPTLGCVVFTRLSGRVSADTVKAHFGKWSNGLKQAGLAHLCGRSAASRKSWIKPPVHLTNEEMIEDLRRVFAQCGKPTLIQLDYAKHGRCRPGAISERFDSWVTALRLAEIPVLSGDRAAPSPQRMMENFAETIRNLGRWPRHREMKRPVSFFSRRPYLRRWGTWAAAKRAYAEWAAAENAKAGAGEKYPIPPEMEAHRMVSIGLRYAVLRRDDYRCVICGAPANKEKGVTLEIDHIVPLAKGGLTEIENLQTLCWRCNHGKSDHDMYAPGTVPGDIGEFSRRPLPGNFCEISSP